MTDLVVSDLTQSTLEGTGVFDVLMRATKAHLEAEFSKNRIKGTEYATVYLGSLESVMRTSMEFLLQKQRIGLEAQLLAQQILLAQLAVEKANVELSIMQATLLKIPAEIAQLTAQTALTTQQKLNAVIEGTVLTATECKLKAEFDVLMVQKLKGASENSLLLQKVVTEAAQTTATGVDDNSVIGRQKALYLNQSDGFKRDAEQKATKILLDTWNVRKTADGDDPALGLPVTNTDIVAAVLKLKAGIAA